MPAGHARSLSALKAGIQQAQVRAALSVNAKLIELYWWIGSGILDRQKNEGWGAKVVERLAHDLLKAFPEMTGLSPRNLFYMRALAEAYPDRSTMQQLVARLPWGHDLVLLDRLKTTDLRAWYAKAALHFGWSRSVLAAQIDGHAHKRHGKAITNFDRTLPPTTSDLAHQVRVGPAQEAAAPAAIGFGHREGTEGTQAPQEEMKLCSDRCTIDRTPSP